MMNDCSITTHAIEAIRQTIERTNGRPDYHGAGKTWGEVADRMQSSQVFRLPAGGSITGVAIGSGKDLGEIFVEWGTRIPYESIVIEYEAIGPMSDGEVFSGRRVVLAYQMRDPQWPDGTLAVAPMWSIPSSIGWAPPLIIYAVHPDGKIQVIFSPLDTETKNQLILDSCQEVAAVAELIAALSCVNVKTIDVPPPVTLNRKRVRRGKVPFFTFKVLEITSAGRRSKGDAVGSHASPRVHLRRGHIRRLETGNVWVNACVVGDKSLGMVTKEYSVRGDSE